jgi:aspartyl/asparaginyl beta-hydroxylase (cupin superfamily)
MTAVYDPSDFPWLDPITARWKEIRTYAQYRKSTFSPYRQTQLYNAGWSVLGIINGQTDYNRYNTFLSPIFQKLPYRPFIAALSCLAPGTEIAPHVGITDSVLRFHLGLVCPENCGIMIDGQTFTWQEGRWLIFNDRLEHSAWNHGDQDRMVLIMDFEKNHIGID